MMKRGTEVLEDDGAGDAKRIHIEMDGQTAVLEDGTTVIIQQAEGGEMVIAEDTLEQSIESDTPLQIATDGTVQVVSAEDEQIDFPTGSVQYVTATGEQVDEAEEVLIDEPVQLTDGEQIITEDQQIIEDESQYQNIIIQHMDIAEPLVTLRKLLEARLQCSLHDHEFWLQDSIQLEPTKSLASQCVDSKGMVQINVEVKSNPGVKPRLNIVDILKPAEVDPPPQPEPQPATTTTQPTKVVIPFPEESENITRWIVDQNFRKEQERLKIPFDPGMWNEHHVKHWIQWAVKEFSLTGVDISQFNLTGKELCDLQHEDFVRLIPNDKGDIFWTHLELLRKCKFVAVIQQPTPHAITTITVSTSDIDGRGGLVNKAKGAPKLRTIMIPSDRTSSPGNRTGNNGQIQLWQFLLELLTDKNCREVIHWLGDDGEFKLNNPEMVAQMWGQRKNKPTMNYEKLSRALRYYYDGDMIAKVHGKRFVYKFVCDLRMLLGYTAGELNRLVTECAERKLRHVRDSLRTAKGARIPIGH